MKEDFDSLAFYSLGQLRHEISSFDCVFLAGPDHWYSEYSYLFDGSRSRQIYFIYYSWLAQKYEESSLNGLSKHASNLPKKKIIVIPSFTNNKLNEEMVILEEDIFSAVKVENQESSRLSVGEGAAVAARQIDLAGGYSVFLEEKASVRILDKYDSIWDTPKIDVRRIKKGMYILLRCDGDGDYVRATAEKLYGGLYDKCMANLISWKEVLQSKINEDGLDSVVSRLIKLDSNIASDTNVLNWASLYTIKPMHVEDFMAIMNLIGRNSEDSSNLWLEARQITNWHHQAGKRVARELRNSIAQFVGEETEKLIKYGHMKVDLASGASIDVFEIVGIAESSVEKVCSQLNKPFSQE
jgi:hypothetical protein